ncbi:MAG: HNH endonuclease signature motif containing protein, partial [Arthrobacter sp.]
RKNYRLTETIKRWIRMRDAKCTFPGCTNRTPDNETDHLQAWEHGGTTGTTNLAQLCPKHHRLKHHSQWTPDPATNNDPPGWTSPTGRHYKPENPDTEPTHWPLKIHAQGRTDVPGGTSEPKTEVNLDGDLLREVAHRPDFHYLDWSPGEDALRRCLHSTG